ncbi:hypothetical protein LSAT2_015298 [Lamellibrachia satsuma]|nr:hypothetical protein LSAT2_015298 [Lamellibrachia satsuma]
MYQWKHLAVVWLLIRLPSYSANVSSASNLPLTRTGLIKKSDSLRVINTGVQIVEEESQRLTWCLVSAPIPRMERNMSKPT